MIAQTALAADLAATRQADLLSTAAAHRTTRAAPGPSPVALTAVTAAVLVLLLIAILLGSDVIAPAFITGTV